MMWSRSFLCRYPSVGVFPMRDYGTCLCLMMSQFNYKLMLESTSFTLLSVACFSIDRSWLWLRELVLSTDWVRLIIRASAAATHLREIRVEVYAALSCPSEWLRGRPPSQSEYDSSWGRCSWFKGVRDRWRVELVEE